MISPHPNNSYTLAWITAHPEDLTLAITLLDDMHGIPQFQPGEDNNAYILGRIGTHNIVVVCFPAGRAGAAVAAAVGEGVRRTFTGVKWGVLVGVGGGVSCFARGGDGSRKGEDVRLGDVVVGVPGGGYGGVVQYDYGKQMGGGRYEHRGYLNAAPEKLLGYVTLLGALVQRRRRRGGEDCLEGILGGLGEEYGCPVGGRDRLFRTDYGCRGAGGMDGCCDCEDGVVVREKRGSELPVVHLGTIASGSAVVADGAVRDRINEEYGGSILCFETEAAGLMNVVPCLVVKGVGSYADEHRYGGWRPRAIAAASSYAKALILHIPPEQMPQQPEVVQVTELVKEIRGELAQVKATLETGLSRINCSLWDLQGTRFRIWKEFFQWLLPYGYGKQRRVLEDSEE